MAAPDFFEIFKPYFEGEDTPSLSDFVQKHIPTVAAYHDIGDNMQEIWANHYKKAFSFNYKSVPKRNQPKMELDGVSWGDVAIKIVSRQAQDFQSTSSTSTAISSSAVTTTAAATTTATTVSLSERFFEDYKQTFDKMKINQKWVLSTGKVVEDVMFSFGMTLKYEHCVHSFIIDMSDPNFRQIFTKEEVQEIEAFHQHHLPAISNQLQDYVNSFIGLTTIASVEERCRKRVYDFNEDFDLNWAQQSIQNALRLYQSNFFPITDQSEADMIRKVWCFIDTAFDNVAIDVRAGELESLASSERRNANRRLNEGKKHGHKTDFLFKCSGGELGCTEVGKECRELGLKVPKMQKDQLQQLLQKHPDHQQDIATIGFVMMGLKIHALVMDSPSTYLCRIKKTPAKFFPSTIEDLCTNLGNIIGLIYQMKQLACATFNTIRIPRAVTSTEFESYSDEDDELPLCIGSP